MNRKQQIEINKALAEIGEIKPWWSKKDRAYVFEHPLYPFVDYIADTAEEVIEKYPQVLAAFISDRLDGEIAEALETITHGSAGNRGGKRLGAGRPKGSCKSPTKMVRLPIEIALWLKADPANIDRVQQLIQDSA